MGLIEGVRGSYQFRNPEDREKFYAFLKAEGRNPELGPEPSEDSTHKRWNVAFDLPPVLTKDTYSPADHQRHYDRPEWQRLYGHTFSPQKPKWDRCCVQVWGGPKGITPSQCNNKARHDEDHSGRPTRCKIHSREYVSAKQKKADAKYQAQMDVIRERREKAKLKQACLDLVRQIAKGHNDPRTAAMELLAKHNDQE